MTTTGLYVDDLESDAGPGAPLVVLVHGSMDRHTSFARVRSRLMDRFHVVSYDRRGYGQSRAATPPAADLDDHVADLDAVVAGRRCTLAGHSYGGTVALTFAARRPDLVAACLAYEPPLGWLPSWPSHLGSREDPFGGRAPAEAAEAFARRIIGEERYERLPLTTREELRLDGEALVAELTAIRADPAPFDPAEIVVPVLLARGERTLPHQVDGVAWLAERISHCRVAVVAGAGHSGHQSHPAEFAALVAEAVSLGDSEGGQRP